MYCGRCNFAFCWYCMTDLAKHNKWYAVCLKLEFGIYINIILVLLAMIFMPVIFTLGPLSFALFYSMFVYVELAREKICFETMCLNYMVWLPFLLLFLLPTHLALAALVSGLLLTFGIVLGLYYGFSYLIRVIPNVAFA